LAGAKIEVAGQSLSATAKPGGGSVTLKMKLKSGTLAKPLAWFAGKDGGVSGMFYGMVGRLG
jgi:hypothetical protein